jgi:hypothetical protein
MDNRKLVQLAAALQGKSAAEVDQELHRRHLDVVERIAVKHQLAATGSRTVRAGHAEARPRNAMDRLMERSNIDPAGAYTELELSRFLQRAGLGPEEAIAVKVECQAPGLLATPPRGASAAERLLENLGIDGPVSLEFIERQMDQLGYGPTAKAVVKSALQAKHWLKSSGSSRTMKASAERGTRLVDRRGRPVTLKSRP